MAVNLSPTRPADSETGAVRARRTPGAERPGESWFGLAAGAGEKAPPSRGLGGVATRRGGWGWGSVNTHTGAKCALGRARLLLQVVGRLAKACKVIWDSLGRPVEGGQACPSPKVACE